MTDYTVYTDGACSPNPGPGGLGAVRICNRTGQMETRSAFRPAATNNYMEVLAVIYGLRMTPEGCSVEIVSDSQYAINCLKGEWRRNVYHEMFAFADALMEKRTVTFRWVRGHAGDRYNEMADRLASGAIRTGAGKPQVFSAPGSAMDVAINIPKGVRRRMVPASAPEWARKYRVSPSCAESLVEFMAKDSPKFRDYASLRSGGYDAWSVLEEDAMVKKGKVSKAVLAGLRKNLGDRHMFLEGLRWYCRGLPLEESVRKTLVNREISMNGAHRTEGRF